MKKNFIFLVILLVIICLAIIFFIKYQKVDTESISCKGLGESPQMIGPGITNPSSCCEGLQSTQSIDIFDENCVNLFEINGGAGNPSLCLACGDQFCDIKYESKCNCPIDCK